MVLPWPFVSSAATNATLEVTQLARRLLSVSDIFEDKVSHPFNPPTRTHLISSVPDQPPSGQHRRAQQCPNADPAPPQDLSQRHLQVSLKTLKDKYTGKKRRRQ